MKRKDNQLTPPDCGCQEELMTASGTFMTPYAQNLYKNHIKWHLVFNLAVLFTAGNNATWVQQLHKIVRVFQ